MSDIKVQRGTVDVGNTGGADTLTAVSGLSSAFEYNSNNLFTHGGSTSSGGNMEGDDMSGMVELTATDTITLTRQANSLANNMRFDWQVIEYIGSPGGANEFIVRSRNTITMSGNSGSATLDTAPDNIDRCIPFITGVRTSQTSNNGDELRVAAHINDSGTLIVQKGSTTNTTFVQVVTVEFTGSNWTVLHGTATSSGDTGSITLNTDSDGAGGSAGNISDWSTALIEGGFTSTDQGLDSIACRYAPGTSSTVNWDFQSGNSSSHNHFVHVLQNDDLSVTRYTPVGSLANNTNVDITSAGLTSLDSAMIIGTCQGSGGGTAYGRNWRNYRITSLTNAQHYCHRSGNTINHNIQIIDFENVEDSGGSTLLTVNESSHSHNSEAPTVSHSYSLVLNESGHNQSAESPSLAHGYNLSPSDSLHNHTAEGTTLSHKYNLSSNESLHNHLADSVTLSGSVDLSVNDSAHSHLAEGGTISHKYGLSLNDSNHTHLADQPTISHKYSLSTNEGPHAHTADNVNLGSSVDLSPNDGGHLHNADGAILSVKYNLSAEDTNHAHSAENTSLSHGYNIVPAETNHNHTADSVTLGFGASLSPDDSDHVHSADGTILTHKYNLAPVDNAHTHQADNVNISSGVSLNINDGVHTHSSEGVNLSQGYVLTVNESGHNHISSGVLLSPGFNLLVNEGGHSHTARSAFVSHKYALMPEESLHDHNSDLTIVTIASVLSAESTTHSHTATEVAFVKDRVDLHSQIQKKVRLESAIKKKEDLTSGITKRNDFHVIIEKSVTLH